MAPQDSLQIKRLRFHEGSTVSWDWHSRDRCDMTDPWWARGRKPIDIDAGRGGRTSMPPAEGRDASLEFIGIGFGPSNLALAVAADEIIPNRRGLFLERSR